MTTPEYRLLGSSSISANFFQVFLFDFLCNLKHIIESLQVGQELFFHRWPSWTKIKLTIVTQRFIIKKKRGRGLGGKGGKELRRACYLWKYKSRHRRSHLQGTKSVTRVSVFWFFCPTKKIFFGFFFFFCIMRESQGTLPLKIKLHSPFTRASHCLGDSR